VLDVIFTQDAVPKFGNDQIWLAGIDLLKVALGNLNQRVSIAMGGGKTIIHTDQDGKGSCIVVSVGIIPS
jgi:hypothetical protein